MLYYIIFNNSQYKISDNSNLIPNNIKIIQVDLFIRADFKFENIERFQRIYF